MTMSADHIRPKRHRVLPDQLDLSEVGQASHQ